MENENCRNESKYINSYSIKSAAALDFLALFQYPLCPVPLCICNGGRTGRRANKSKLKEVLLMRVGSLDKSVLASFPKDILLVDIIALINK